MPISKQRHISGSKRPRKRGPKSPLETVNGVIRIKRNIFDIIRSDEDFAAMVRMGRLMNVLAYMMEVVHDGPPIDEKNPLTLRRFVRTTFNTAGYVYEGYELVTSLYPKYFKKKYFTKFAELYNDPDKTRKRKTMQLMRNAGAFHLDSENKSTKKALAGLKLNKIDLISGADGTYSTLYFHLADTLDINYVVDQLKETSDDDEGEIYRTMGVMAVDLLGEFIRAADQFVEGVARELKLVD